jgi:transposase
MAVTREDLPEEIDALRAALLAECARAARVEVELAVARAKASDDAAVIAHQPIADRETDAPALRAAFGAHCPAA